MTTFHTAQVDGLNVFYRQAGDPTNPKLLLLGGFPSSSHQFRNLMPALADHFHVVSPDYPGFGRRGSPPPGMASATSYGSIAAPRPKRRSRLFSSPTP